MDRDPVLPSVSPISTSNPFEGSESNPETRSEYSDSRYSFRVGDEEGYTASGPPVDLRGQVGLSDRGPLGRFREHLYSHEDLRALGDQQATFASDSPQLGSLQDPFVNQDLIRRFQGLPPLELGNTSNTRLNPETGSSSVERFSPERSNPVGYSYQEHTYLPLPSEAGDYQSRANSVPIYPYPDQFIPQKPKKHRASISGISSAIKNLFHSKKPRSIKSVTSFTDRDTRKAAPSSGFIRKWKHNRAEAAARKRIQELIRKG